MPREKISLRGERKSFELKSARSPYKHPYLASTVLIEHKQEGTFFCHIRFSQDFVEFVGRKLLRGVSTDDPAYISVVVYGCEYRILARYLNSPESSLLWQTQNKPEWLRFRKFKNGPRTSPHKIDSNRRPRRSSPKAPAGTGNT